MQKKKAGTNKKTKEDKKGSCPLIWHTEKRKVKDLIHFEKNPRRISDEQKKQLQASLERFNLVEIPAVNTDNRIIAGHQRIKVLSLLGRDNEEIDVRIPNRPLTKEEYEEYLIRSNKNQGEWDWDLLANFGEDFLKELGFDGSELDKIFDYQIEDDKFDAQKEYEKIKEPKSKTGDVYQLGDHKLMCGDSTVSEDINKLIAGNKIDLIYCDPVYNIKLDYCKGVGTKGKYSDSGIVKDNKKDTEYKYFLDKTIKNALSHTKENTHVFYWCDQKYIGLLQQLFKENGIKPNRVCLWIKNGFSPTPQNAFNKCYEPCVYGIKGKPALSKEIRNLTEILNKDISARDLLECVLAQIDLWINKRDNTQNYEHPTQKPLTLHEKPLKRCSNIGSSILDLFGGSGSTLIACEQLKRRCFMCEIDPKYVDVIIKRWEQLTGKKAVLLK